MFREIHWYIVQIRLKIDYSMTFRIRLKYTDKQCRVGTDNL